MKIKHVTCDTTHRITLFSRLRDPLYKAVTVSHMCSLLRGVGCPTGEKKKKVSHTDDTLKAPAQLECIRLFMVHPGARQ